MSFPTNQSINRSIKGRTPRSDSGIAHRLLNWLIDWKWKSSYLREFYFSGSSFLSACSTQCPWAFGCFRFRNIHWTYIVLLPLVGQNKNENLIKFTQRKNGLKMFILSLCIYFFVEFCDAQWISHSACFVFHSKTGLKSISPVPVDADVCVWRPWKPLLSRPTGRVSFSKKVLSIDWLVPFRFALVNWLIDWFTRLIVRSIDLLTVWFHFALLCFDWLTYWFHSLD